MPNYPSLFLGIPLLFLTPGITLELFPADKCNVSLMVNFHNIIYDRLKVCNKCILSCLKNRAVGTPWVVKFEWSQILTDLDSKYIYFFSLLTNNFEPALARAKDKIICADLNFEVLYTFFRCVIFNIIC